MLFSKPPLDAFQCAFTPKYSQPGGAASPLPASALPQPHPKTAENTKIKLFAKTAQYRNQIFTLQRVFPLKFKRVCPLILHSSLVDAASKNGIDNRIMKAAFDIGIVSVDKAHLQA